MSLVVVERPSVDTALGHLERFPFDREDMRKDFPKALPLFRGHSLVESDYHPIHLSAGEVAAKVAAEPKLGTSQICAAVVSLVDLVGDVEPAVVLHLSMVVVSRRMRVEIAHAEVRT